ncbi:hypothetical protein TL5118_00734 [Thalassovita autumnalis]|uniref:Uncharacterized protein n=1 Tax=Thalassovita autumnalis TaxID=2072972 RepID=A0A0P1F7X8_9RHOB|nr:hypothetical protein TL5118_00734 [Thalassovita autumnalis]CUH72805.1 hypothetical protein TL5120_02602 [Thalassovita autumnalis]
MERDGTTERVSTEYWNGVIAVDRKTAKSRIEMQVPATAKSLDLSVGGKKYTLPMTMHINGKDFGRGTYIVRPIKRTDVQIGKCRYPAMIVRTTLRMENRADINEEALLSLEAGMLLGNVAMTATWQPKHGVLFDRIEGHEALVLTKNGASWGAVWKLSGEWDYSSQLLTRSSYLEVIQPSDALGSRSSILPVIEAKTLAERLLSTMATS